MNVLDRFLVTIEGKEVLQNRDQYQLAAMTSLYLSVKTNEPEVMSAELIATLSRGAHSADRVEAMELRILKALTWLVNPPTTLSFIRQFLELLPPMLMQQEMKVTLYDISRFQTELAVADYSLMAISPSTIAYACVMNSLQSLCMDRNALGFVSSILSESARINIYSPELAHVQVRLCDSVTQHSLAGKIARSSVVRNSNEKYPRRSSYEASPCSVTMMGT